MYVHVHGARCPDDLTYSSILFVSRRVRNVTPILLIEVGLSPIESLAMTRLLLYKHKINNMGDHRLPKIAFNSIQNHLPKLAFNSIQNHLRLKQGWYKDTRAWLNHWEIDETVTLKNINNITNIVTSKFEE